MKIQIEKCEYVIIKDKLVQQIRSLSSPIDSFLEDHIWHSQHYEILCDSIQIGYFSVFKKSLLTQFYIDPAYRHLSQKIFFQVKRFEYIEKAFVPTCDEFFLSHAIDEHVRMERQAYFFQDGNQEMIREKKLKNFTYQPAKLEDLQFIQAKSGDFFEQLEKRIEQGNIFIGKIDGEPVTFGIIEKSRIYKATASIGLFTLEEHRGQGYGRNIILCLKEECQRQGLEPIAGCWYYNHNSKKTLESAGMYSQTRLLAIYF